MAASFIAFEVVGAVSDWENGEVLVNKNNIIGVLQTADNTLEILTTGGTPGDKVVLTLGDAPSGAITSPVMASGLGTKAFNYALTANPGGIKAKVFLGKDDNGAQMYVRNVEFSQMKPKGLGDSIANFTQKTGIKHVVDIVSDGLNINCGCNNRQEWFNNKFPYRNDSFKK